MTLLQTEGPLADSVWARPRRYTFLVLAGLKANPLPWLLEEDNPSVRYFTFVDIEKKGEPSKRVTLLALKALKPYL
jgi:hypothetical protein